MTVHTTQLLLTSTIVAFALSGCSANMSESKDLSHTPQSAQHSDVGQTHIEAKKTFVQDKTLPPLPIEETGIIETLPAQYPESWMFVDESSFPSQFGGKMIIIDVKASKSSDLVKGTADKNLVGNFTNPKTRPEFYIVESFHERGSRGPRTELLVIYDKVTLSPILIFL